MGLQYVAEARLRSMMIELIRTHVASVTDLRLEARRGPYLPGNWRIEWLNVPVEDYGAARDVADMLQDKRHWILVPDGHAFDGWPMGREPAG